MTNKINAHNVMKAYVLYHEHIHKLWPREWHKTSRQLMRKYLMLGRAFNVVENLLTAMKEQ